MGAVIMEKIWVVPLIISSFISILLLATSFNVGLVSTLNKMDSIFFLFPSPFVSNQRRPLFVEEKLSQSPPTRSSIPRFAYLISGSKGDLEKLWRTLRALYHPLNHYVLHLDLESPSDERLELASRVESDAIFHKIGNVYVVKKANMVTYRGPTMVANTLHAGAILLERSSEWDWFINLSASDYPLVTQDDLLFVFRRLKRNLNFVEHTSNLDWKEAERGMPLIVDPGLYRTTKSDIFWVTPQRTLPTSFKLFTGSAWMILSRPFVEYLVWGWDNLPRTLLMYHANFVSSPEHYFHTVICNSPDFITTIINHDLHYISWDTPPKQHPHTLSMNHTAGMISSGAAFARKFGQGDPVLDRIDSELLQRRNGSFTSGGWCSGNPSCSRVGKMTKLKPGPGARRLSRLISKAILSSTYSQNQCQ